MHIPKLGFVGLNVGKRLSARETCRLSALGVSTHCAGRLCRLKLQMQWWWWGAWHDITDVLDSLLLQKLIMASFLTRQAEAQAIYKLEYEHGLLKLA